MTRINVSIPPKCLSDKHLLAEHREIVRVRLTQLSKSEPPNNFTLGKGHVLFFKNKLGYIFKRYKELYQECLNRKFNITDMSSSFNEFDLNGDYIPNINDNLIIKKRLIEKLNTQSHKYYGKNVDKEFLINLLK